jgi:hypothetical protein
MSPAELIAEQTADAYSAGSYGEAEWTKCTQQLLDAGLGEREVEAFLRSKHMRWAEDFSGEFTAAGLAAYLAGPWFKNDLHDEARALLTPTRPRPRPRKRRA